MDARGKTLTFEMARFIKFIVTEIFPGGRLPSTEMMVEHARRRVSLTRRHRCGRTTSRPSIWGETLESHKDEAIEVASEEVYNRYMKYLSGCEHYFADEMLDCSLVTYLKPGAVA